MKKEKQKKNQKKLLPQADTTTQEFKAFTIAVKSPIQTAQSLEGIAVWPFT